MKITANRYHDISCGHRVVGHEGKCRFLHGHNYRVHFYCEAEQLDTVGRVIDFGVIKEKLCMWIENKWDHKFLAWEQDSVMRSIVNKFSGIYGDLVMIDKSVVWLPFNPTAENMGEYLLNTIGPKQLEGTGVRLIRVVIEETRKCSVTCEVGE